MSIVSVIAGIIAFGAIAFIGLIAFGIYLIWNEEDSKEIYFREQMRRYERNHSL